MHVLDATEICQNVCCKDDHATFWKYSTLFNTPLCESTLQFSAIIFNMTRLQYAIRTHIVKSDFREMASMDGPMIKVMAGASSMFLSVRF